MNLTFPKGPFTEFLASVFDAGKVMSDGIDLSQITGTLKTYSYFGPKGRDYIIETSTDIRDSLDATGYGWMAKYFFDELLTDPVRSNPSVKELNIYLINQAGTWSLIHPRQKLDPALAERIIKNRREEISSDDGRYLTVYSGEPTKSATDPDHPVTSKFVIRKITYDVGLAREAVLQVFISSMIVLALLMPIVFWIASRLLQRQLLDPLFNLRGEAGAIAEGDLNQAIANTDRRDEIGQLANSFAAMRDAVRKTITDLRDTNISIERFVPQAFLAIVGKPSIVEVELGDNKRKDMTILFSDIRNFTTLSEAMTPDENFAFINAYLERMGPVIRAHNGFIDKYIGDAIMALFESADDALQGRARHARDARCLQCRAPRRRPAADRHRRRHQHRHPDDGHDRREASHGRHGHFRRRQPRLAHRGADQDLWRRPAGLAVHRGEPGRCQGLRHPSDRRRRGQGQDPAGHDLRGIPARSRRPAHGQGRHTRPAAVGCRGVGAPRPGLRPSVLRGVDCRSCPATWRPAISSPSALLPFAESAKGRCRAAGGGVMSSSTDAHDPSGPAGHLPSFAGEENYAAEDFL